MTDVKLSRTYEAHGTAFSSVSLRAPTLVDLFAIGEPIEVHPGPDGSGSYVLQHRDRLRAYLDQLAVPDKPGLHAIQGLDLVDAMAIEEAILGFFTAARRQLSKPTR